MEVYIVGTYTRTENDSWMYCRAFATKEEAEKWIEEDKLNAIMEEMSGGAKADVEYEIFTDNINI